MAINSTKVLQNGERRIQVFKYVTILIKEAKMIRFSMMLLVLLSVSSIAQETNTCLTCHLDIEEEGEPAHLFKNDIHKQAGLSCASCHGGDPTSEDVMVSMSPENGFIGVPSKKESPKICASCHSDENFMKKYNPNIQTNQYEQYLTSKHGNLWKKGDTKVATCIDCHSVHNIRKVKDFNSPVYAPNVPATCANCHSDESYMKDYSIPTNQLAEYNESVHGKLLLEEGERGAPACNDCHGNHGAIPPGVQSISLVCGNCHVLNMNLYLESPKRPIFQDFEIPECESCHGNHDVKAATDKMLGVGEEAICSECHQDPEMESYHTIQRMSQLIDSLKQQASLTDSLLDKAEGAGMEVSEGRFEYSEVKNSLVKARSLIHAFELDTLKSEVNKGLKKNDDLHQYALSALGEIDYRRTGLLIALVFILILIGGIYFKMREVDKKYNVK